MRAGDTIMALSSGSLPAGVAVIRLSGPLVRTALDKTHGNQARAAELLGLSRFGLQKMMKRLHIGRPQG